MNGLYDEIRVALHAIWTRRWLALAVAWAIAILGWLVVSQIPNSYESRARVFVQMQTILPDKVGITPGPAAEGRRYGPPDADLCRQPRKGRARHRSRQHGVERPRRRRSRRRPAKGDQDHRPAGQSVRDHRDRVEPQDGAHDRPEADRHLRRAESRRRPRRDEPDACASSMPSSTSGRSSCRMPRPSAPTSRTAISVRCRAPDR